MVYEGERGLNDFSTTTGAKKSPMYLKKGKGQVTIHLNMLSTISIVYTSVYEGERGLNDFSTTTGAKRSPMYL